jgi:hypothetical protein
MNITYSHNGDSSDAVTKEIALANARYAGDIVICMVDDKGWGLMALRNLEKGERIIQSKTLETMTVPNSHTIQMDWHRHVLLDLPARFVNHRCHTANLGLKENQEEQTFEFYVLRDIAKGEELTWDYCDTEYDMESPFTCTCGDTHCRKIVRGWKYEEKSSCKEDTTANTGFLPQYRLQYEASQKQKQ